ncbi:MULTISPECIES: phosphate signaling complex protein PhoU [Larsenimonas]|uniref:Phosphate-specific transport system accessory protein PhoU n=1 Tax=Larsenimonas suaedae TaxID=1851019 RepID=A0ABU1GX03_9GAMM|nr:MULTISPECIES: phosphate signaling complex protein PhoU [Larsenimonas]MCM2973183.1 phosphate signaling complex protein PhoU [Larsenimonas suaedae]MCM5705638.1 phosphate signaling complex protein PhoU [Larsenimonas salina]MDR5896076.1 phosphate signaling complex protein PhoU [Larsenimonas suaedae]
MDIDSGRHSQHISSQFNQELEALKTHLMAMGGLVERQVQDAIDALLEGHAHQAQEVCRKDQEVNEMQLRIDDECTHIIARRQPAASDLRLVLAVTRTASDLERIGDEANKIARNALSLIEEGHTNHGFVEVRRIGQQVREMLRNALTAFARFDTELSIQVLHTDEAVDSEYRSSMRSLVTFMMEDPRSIGSILNIMWVLRALERIGDHANNLAESVIYLVKGLDIRHTDISGLDTKKLDS